MEPVARGSKGGFQYARRFTLGLLNFLEANLEDDPIEFRAGDSFIALVFDAHSEATDYEFFRRLRVCGVRIYFVILNLPEAEAARWRRRRAARARDRWLEIVAESDGAFCVSKTLADALVAQLKTSKHAQSLKIDWPQSIASRENPAEGAGQAADIKNCLSQFFEMRVLHQTCTPSVLR